MTVEKSTKILTSKDEIRAYLGGISNHLFTKYIKAGLPARFEDGRWLAHTENIDEFFKAYTRVSMRKVISQFPDVSNNEVEGGFRAPSNSLDQPLGG